MPEINAPTYWAIAPEQAQAFFASLRDEANLRAEAIRPQDYLPDSSVASIAQRITRNVNGIAVINIDAPLDVTSQVGWLSGKILTLGHDAIRHAVQTALDDPSSRAILLSINSPGGTVQGSKELADFLADAAGQKPLAAYANGLCASAAFWLAAGCGRIFAPATALLGSIGVIMCLSDYSALYEKMGLKLTCIFSGKFKAAGNDSQALSQEERAYFQDRLDSLHSIFKEDIRNMLNITAPDANWAEAQLLVADKAKALGLVSSIVRDEAEAIQLLVEENMPQITLEILAKDAPELLAEIRESARAEALAEMSQQKPAAQSEDQGLAFALAAMRLIFKSEDVAACENFLAKASSLKLSVEQLCGLKELIPTKAQAPSASKDSTPEKILAALSCAHGQTLPQAQDTNPNAKSPLLADAEKRARS